MERKSKSVNHSRFFFLWSAERSALQKIFVLRSAFQNSGAGGILYFYKKCCQYFQPKIFCDFAYNLHLHIQYLLRQNLFLSGFLITVQDFFLHRKQCRKTGRENKIEKGPQLRSCNHKVQCHKGYCIAPIPIGLFQAYCSQVSYPIYQYSMQSKLHLII